MTKEDTQQDEEVSVIYLHVYHDGQIFLMTDEGTIFENADLSQLRTEVQKIEKEKGVVKYSIDEHGELSPEAQKLTNELAKSKAHFESVDKPHPAVYGYDRSYVEYIYDAVEVAEMDLAGLSEKLTVEENLLKSQTADSEEHQESTALISELNSKIEFAKYALKKIKELELDLCSETEGKEH